MDERPPMERALSTDVVIGIVLSHVKVRDLLNCRKVSKFWNTAASSVLRRRSTMIKNISNEKTLMRLEECLKQNSDFPFAGLTFYEPWRLTSVGGMTFLKHHGEKFTGLYLGAPSETRIQDLAPFINQLPRLAILEIGDFIGSPPRAELSSDSGLQQSSSAGGQEDGKILNLQSLRTFKISSHLNEDVLRQVCTTAHPSLRIECLGATYETLKELKRLGKLEAVTVIREYQIIGSREYEKDAWRVAKLLSTESPPLTELDIDIKGSVSREGLIKLLISSQHTLNEMKLRGIYPSEFLYDCPVLTKLTSLGLGLSSYDGNSIHVFGGIQGHKFPALKELRLSKAKWNANLSNGSFVVPSLKRIVLYDYDDLYGIEDLAWSFPNVIEIELNDIFPNCEKPWEDNMVDIWSVGAFKCLEKLRIGCFNTQPPTENMVERNMDSFLTGIPMEICEDLRKKNQQSPFNETLRDSPNILQLKNLKELIICLKPVCGLEEPLEEPPFISMVSVWYALKMMPHLQMKFVFKYNRCCVKEDDRDKAVGVLEETFKLVEPYVELENSFDQHSQPSCFLNLLPLRRCNVK